MNCSVKALFSLLLLAAGMTASAATWIVDFTGKPEDFRLERGNQTLPVEIYRQLQRNDRLFVLVDDNTIFLKQDDGHQIEIRRDNSPYLIRDPGRPPTGLDNFLHPYRTWLTQQRLEKVDQRPVIGIYTRAPGEPVPPISLPLASGAKVRLSAGTRHLYLAWQGGEPPYQVRLTNAAGKEILRQTDIAAPGGNAQPFKTAPAPLTPGQYRLIISDAQRQATVTVEVTPAIPLLPATTLTGVTNADIRQTLEALWLASQGEAWRLEAYQRVMPLEAQHRPARLLRYSLEKGQAPPAVKTD